MKHCYVYTNIKEVFTMMAKGLKEGSISRVHDSNGLFELAEGSFVLLHTEAFEDSGLGTIEQLKEEIHGISILALSSKVIFSEGVALLQAGANGYGNVYMHPALLQQAIDVIHTGNIWLYPEFAHHLIKGLKKKSHADESALYALSPVEKECAVMASQGYSNINIADTLKVQEITVKKHMSSIFKKLNVKNRMELALFLK